MNEIQLNDFIKLCIESMDKQELISYIKYLTISNNALEDEIEALKKILEIERDEADCYIDSMKEEIEELKELTLMKDNRIRTLIEERQELYEEIKQYEEKLKEYED